MSSQMTDIDIALAEVRATQAACRRLETALERVRERAAQDGKTFLPSCEVLPTDHRREHRMGRAPIIDSHPELQAFILARLDRLTFKQIADEIARHLPPDLHVHQATVHRWSQKRR